MNRKQRRELNEVAKKAGTTLRKINKDPYTSVIVDNFLGVNWFGKTRKFPCFTIYYSPRDFPGKYVVRLFDANMPTRLVAVKNTLEDARATIPQDQQLPYMRFEASEKDAPSIVESWM